MKHLIIFTFLFITTASLAQKIEILGNWTLVSINNGEVYYNTEKDSISILPEFGRDNLSDSEIQQLKEVVKMTYGHTQFTFNEDGIYKWIFMPSIELSGKYDVDRIKQTIILYDENSLGETTINDFSYQIINDQLEIIVNFSEPKGKYVLKRK